MSKRARITIVNGAEESEYIDIRVVIRPSCIEPTSGRRPRAETQAVRFKRSEDRQFWQLWSHFQEYMLCREGDYEPFVDMDKPVDRLGTTRFYAVPWEREYRPLMHTLAMRDIVHKKQLVEAKLAAAEAEVLKHQEARDAFDETIAKIQAKIDALSQESSDEEQNRGRAPFFSFF